MEFLVTLWFLLTPSIAFPETRDSSSPFQVRFENHNKPVTRATLPLQRLRVFDPYEQTPIEFEGYLLTDVLDSTYGREWRNQGATHQLRMKCLDGYRLSVPLSRVLAHKALIAVRRVDHSPFTILKKDVMPPKTVDLAPAYLVWENEEDLTIRAEGDFGWPFQWQEALIEKLGVGDSLPLPKKGSTSMAVQGYSEFKMHCLKCHSIDGLGGKVGPELNHPRNVTQYWQKGMLVEWILDPPSFRIPNGMPPLSPSHPNRKQMAREIVEYLSSIPNQKSPKKEAP